MQIRNPGGRRAWRWGRSSASSSSTARSSRQRGTWRRCDATSGLTSTPSPPMSSPSGKQLNTRVQAHLVIKLRFFHVLWQCCGSVSGSRRAKMTHKKVNKFHFLKYWMFSFEGFPCSLDLLYGGLGISKLQFLIKKRYLKKFQFFSFIFCSSKPWIHIRILSSALWNKLQYLLVRPFVLFYFACGIFCSVFLNF
jgi:hypothetical protein